MARTKATTKSRAKTQKVAQKKLTVAERRKIERIYKMGQEIVRIAGCKLNH